MSKIKNKQTWAIKTAARLRAVQSSFSDLGGEDRGGYLLDEIEYALEDASSLPGENRHSLLNALEELFPVYGDFPPMPPTPPASIEPSATRDFSVSGMIDEICDRADELTPTQLKKLAVLVTDSGNYIPGNTLPKPVAEKLTFPGSSEEVDDFLKSVRQLWKEMGFSQEADNPVKINRLLKMLGILTGGFRDIYRVVWPYWSEMAPREIRNLVSPAYPNGLESVIHSFVTGGEVGGGEFHSEIEKTKKILLSILFGLRKGAEEYGKLYERKFSPEAITDTVVLEESASDVNRVREIGRKCWDKYSQLSKYQTADAIQGEIVKTMAEAAFTKLKLSS